MNASSAMMLSAFLLSLTAAVRAASAAPKSARRRSYATVPGHPCIRSLEGTADAMSDLAKAHPSLASVIEIGDSYLRENPDGAEANKAFPAGGYALKALVLTNDGAPTANADKAKVLIVAGHHPRELGPPELVLRFAETLLAGHGADAEITALLDRTEISLVFHANPDGRHVAEARRDLMWRKNANGGRSSSSCSSSRLGVDLNRNYDFFWGDTSGGKASDDPCDNDYAGSKAFSEPESRAVRGLARRLFPRGQRRDDPEGKVGVPVGEDNTGVFVDVHSSGGYIFYPWGYKDSKSPDNDSLEPLARKMASFNGYKLWAGGQPDMQYPVSGDASDYMYAAMGVASFGYEIGKAFYEDCDLFERKIAPDNIPSLMYVSRTARRPFRIAKGPDVLAFEVEEAGKNANANADEETGEAAAATLDVSVTASDNELLNSDFKTGRQGVEAVRLSVDVHPDDDDGGGAMMEMEPVGGTNNNSGRRSFGLQVSTDGMAPGRHTMYSVAVDGAGYEGPVSAVFFDVPVRVPVETDRPATSAPTTAAPVSGAPTAAPISESPTTAAPVSVAPTAAPISESPTTAAPVSGAPTAAPITDSPTTAAPISESPTAAAAVTPTADEPSSQAPTIGKPPAPAPSEARSTQSPTDKPMPTSPPGSPTLRPVATTVGQPGSSQADSLQEPSSHPAADDPSTMAPTAGPNVLAQSVDCPTVMDQVCGADGETYWNDCHATREGVEVAYGGACEEEQVPGLNFVDVQPEDESSSRSSAVAKMGIIGMTLTCGILLATSL